MDCDAAIAKFPSAAIYTNPEILAAYHDWGAPSRSDSKTFVDRPLTANPAEVLQAFRLLPPLPTPSGGAADEDAVRKQYVAFFSKFFDEDPDAASVHAAHKPTDFTCKVPSFAVALGKKLPAEAVEFALALKRIWADLCRVCTMDADTDGARRSSLIPLPHPFIVAGGRFRECYYWDSYWIVKGLLASDMVTTARHVADNLLYLVSLCKFVPNGNRVYYLNRSQPPMLTLTVVAILDHCRAEDSEGGEAKLLPWLRDALPLMDLEYETFIASHQSQTRSASKAGGNDDEALAALSVYRVDASPTPRPESWVEDAEIGAAAGSAGGADLYRGIAAAAESGWDFSSRWFATNGALNSIHTPDIVPVCLNSILVKTERELARLHALVATDDSEDGDGAAASRRYKDLAVMRARALNEVLWCEERGTWCDWDMSTGQSTGLVAASGIFPLWAECWPSSWTAVEASAYVHKLSHSKLVQPGGLAATERESGEQWDFPNAWPPLAEVAVSGLGALGRAFPGSGAEGLGGRIARATLAAMHGEWRRGAVMHEKYDARAPHGRGGGGGEYASQVGFGWTNGVALELMRKGYWPGEGGG